MLPLAVVEIAPSDGARGVDAAVLPTVCFNRVMDAQRAAGSLLLELEGAGPAAGQSLAAAGGTHCLSLRHDRLQPSSTYVIRALPGLASPGGEALVAEVRSRFETSP